MDDVEILPGDDDVEADELLDVGARRRLPRWVTLLAVVLAAAVAITVVVLDGSGSSPQVQPSPTALPVFTPPAPSPVQPAEDLIGAPEFGTFFTLGGGFVSQLSGSGAESAQSNEIHIGGVDGYGAKLLLDPSALVVWVVPIGNARAGTVEGYDVTDLHLVTRVPLPDVVDDAAVLDGTLYLLAGDRLLKASGDRQTLGTAATLDTGQGPIVADPTRHRLLYFANTQPLTIRSWSPSGGTEAKARLPIAKGDLEVVNGSIWVGGFSDGGAKLVRLDPRTLRAGANVKVAAQLGPGAILAGAGDRSLYVRSGSQSDGLWCLDGATGAVRRHWTNLDGIVASTRGTGFSAPTTGPPRPLTLGSCPG